MLPLTITSPALSKAIDVVSVGIKGWIASLLCTKDGMVAAGVGNASSLLSSGFCGTGKCQASRSALSCRFRWDCRRGA